MRKRNAKNGFNKYNTMLLMVVYTSKFSNFQFICECSKHDVRCTRYVMGMVLFQHLGHLINNYSQNSDISSNYMQSRGNCSDTNNINNINRHHDRHRQHGSTHSMHSFHSLHSEYSANTMNTMNTSNVGHNIVNQINTMNSMNALNERCEALLTGGIDSGKVLGVVEVWQERWLVVVYVMLLHLIRLHIMQMTDLQKK